MKRPFRGLVPALLLAVLCLIVSCGDSEPERHGPGRPAGAAGGSGFGRPAAAVPVEVTAVERREISSYIETNGTLEAENEVDVVARVSAPIIELKVEEGDRVQLGQRLARLDPTEFEAQLDIARVTVDETRLAHERAEALQGEALISPEAFERARSEFEGAQAQYAASRIALDYTEITAPFSGLIIRRYIQLAQHVAANTPLFRVSDFDPLLCPIQVPERELSKLRPNQSAYLTVEAFPGERFEASVLRISPVIDAATGTLKVTLAVRSRDKLRPGMFARVFVETERRAGALVIPKAALSLDSIGDTVYVAVGERASRREVTLGFSEGDAVEVLSGLEEHERVVVVGQDGLSEGTPIAILGGPGKVGFASAAGHGGPAGHGDSGGPGGPRVSGPPGQGPERGRRNFDPSTMTPEQLERVKERMRSKGMTDEQIERRLRSARERTDSR